MTVQTVSFMASMTPNVKQSPAGRENSFDSYLSCNNDAVSQASNDSKQINNTANQYISRLKKQIM